VEERRGRLPERRRIQERAPHRSAQRREPVAKRRRYALRERRLFAWSEAALPRHGFGDLEREERIPSRRAVDGAPARARERYVGMRADDALELTGRERPQQSARDPVRRKRSVDLQRCTGIVASYRCEETDALPADEAPEDKPEGIARRRVEPLRVIDRDKRRPVRRDAGDRGQRPTGEGDAIEFAGRVRPPERNAECLALRLRTRRNHVLRNAFEEIRESDERQPRLRFGGTAEQDAERAQPRGRHSRAPDR
jgi:hypothetical protein